MKNISALITLSFALGVALALPGTAQDVLPSPVSPFKGLIWTTVKDSTLDFPKEVQAPTGAPNKKPSTRLRARSPRTIKYEFS